MAIGEGYRVVIGRVPAYFRHCVRKRATAANDVGAVAAGQLRAARIRG